MGDSILTSIKKLLGLPEEYEHFDMDIIMHINAVLMTLTQIGIGPSEGFFITDKTSTWKDFISNGVNVLNWDGSSNNSTNLGALMSYVYIKVKLVFDPPQNSFTIESMNKIAAEFEWRLNSAAEAQITE